MGSQIGKYITGDPAFAVDRRGDVVLWNEAAENTFGYPSVKALGKRCWRLLSGKDTYGNRYCCRHCPVREMAFRNEPVNCFKSVYKTASGQAEAFSVSCLTISDDTDLSMLLHICHPDDEYAAAGNKPAAPRTSASSHPGTLSQREIEILGLLAKKTRTQDIATTLAISIRTVRTHIQHLMYKLQVHKRAEAIQMGKRLNLIP